MSAQPRESGRSPAPGHGVDHDAELELTATLDREPGQNPRDPQELPGRISNYRVNRLLGEGGTGLVYEAEQRSPRRLVALKVMRRGHHVDEVHVRLFNHEAETLARLRHPNIAAIYESGHTDDGRDFFAMELVDGPTLDGWLQHIPPLGSKAALELRLRLLQAICKPVHYAHQRGVIHRDLKPKNIMVVQDSAAARPLGTASLPVVKVLDFGLARITDSDLHGAADADDTGALRGTLPYMSPEQARGDMDAIDVRTDVYALGVMLYEMLTGRRPYSLSTTSLERALRTIREEAPMPMSTAGADPRLVDGELQSIVLKALAKDPDQRYGSVAALDDDLERYLGSIPISTYKNSRSYRTRKFIRRHRSAVAASLVLTLALLFGIAGTTFGLVRARQAETAARHEAVTAARVSSFLADMLASVDAQKMGEVMVSELEERVADAARAQGAVGGAADLAVTTLRAAIQEVSATDTGRRLLDEAILARAGEAVRERFADEPQVAGRLEHTLAETYQRLGMYERAVDHAARAVQIRRGAPGVKAADLLHSQAVLGTLHYRRGDYAAAAELLAATHQAQCAQLGPDHPQSLRTALSRAWVMIDQGQPKAAEELLAATLRDQRRVLGDTHRHTIDTMNSLAVVFTNQGRYADAEKLHSEILQLRSRLLGARDPDTLKSMTNLAVVSFHQGRLDSAAQLFAEVLQLQRSSLGPTHPTTLGSANNLAVIYQQQGRLAEAEELHRWALGEKRRTLGPEHPETLSSLYNLALVHTAEGRLTEAAAAHQEVLEARHRVLGASHPQTLASQSALAGVAALAGRRELALRYLAEAVEHGYNQADSLRTDPDFASLRGDPDFEALVERSRRNGSG